MDEEIALIDKNTRNEKIKNFFKKNKKLLISLASLIIFSLFIFFIYEEFNDRKKIKISDQYNSLIIEYSPENKDKIKNGLIELINIKDPTYSPLSLYFIIDNSLIIDKSKVNKLFDIVINETDLDNEIKNLIIFKKALYNSDEGKESELLDILKPIINSESIWKSHALYLMAEYFYSNNEKQKAKEFFNQIISLEDSNANIRLQAEKRINRDLGE